MARIHELSPTLSNQIAAGEVIERPASVVKELVENAIDANAHRIRIDFVAAGLKSITVQDNGTGIASDQIDLAFRRHATSKINNEHDLFSVSTLGFRGEALASIAAVAHVEIITSTDGRGGSRALFSGGTKIRQEVAAAQKGTRLTVRDLFFNTPARLKYLRSPRTEAMRIVNIVNRLALGHPDIAFILTNNDKVLLQTTGNRRLLQTVANVYGRHIAEQMVPFKQADQDFKVSGLLSKPSLTRSTRNFISLLLNGRYIRNFKLTNAVMAGYGSKLQVKHYPIVVVQMQVDPLLVDVNVHPTKQEVRLSKEKELGRLITSAISDSLLHVSNQAVSFTNLTGHEKDTTLIDQLQFNLNHDVVNTARKKLAVPSVHELKRHLTTPKTNPHFVHLDQPRHDRRYLVTSTWAQNVLLQTKLAPFETEKINSQVISTGEDTLINRLPALTLIGQMKSYLLASEKNDLFLVEQVAARRRLVFDKIKRTLKQKKIMQQGLLTPIVLEFGELDFLQIKSQLREVKKVGLYLDDFGTNSFILRSYPTWIHGDVEASVRAILDEFLNRAHSSTINLLNHVALLQAKREVTGYVKLTNVAAGMILQELRHSSDPYHDAEGNIIIVRISQTSLRKMFKKGS